MFFIDHRITRSPLLLLIASSRQFLHRLALHLRWMSCKIWNLRMIRIFVGGFSGVSLSIIFVSSFFITLLFLANFGTPYLVFESIYLFMIFSFHDKLPLHELFSLSHEAMPHSLHTIFLHRRNPFPHTCLNV